MLQNHVYEIDTVKNKHHMLMPQKYTANGIEEIVRRRSPTAHGIILGIELMSGCCYLRKFCFLKDIIRNSSVVDEKSVLTFYETIKWIVDRLSIEDEVYASGSTFRVHSPGIINEVVPSKIPSDIAHEVPPSDSRGMHVHEIPIVFVKMGSIFRALFGWVDSTFSGFLHVF